jgi:hypothetical protein
MSQQEKLLESEVLLLKLGEELKEPLTNCRQMKISILSCILEVIRSKLSSTLA